MPIARLSLVLLPATPLATVALLAIPGALTPLSLFGPARLGRTRFNRDLLEFLGLIHVLLLVTAEPFLLFL